VTITAWVRVMIGRVLASVAGIQAPDGESISLSTIVPGMILCPSAGLSRWTSQPSSTSSAVIGLSWKDSAVWVP